MGFSGLKAKCLADSNFKPKKIAIAQADGEELFLALSEAQKQGLCTPLFIGQQNRIEQLAQKSNITDFEVIHSETAQNAVEEAVRAINGKRADLIMKGTVPTSTLMKAVLADKGGLRREKFLSHVTLFETGDGSFLGVTDGGLNISPDLKAKTSILNNAVALFHALGIEKPRVALLSAVEAVNPNIPSTVEAAALAQMAERGQIKGAIVDGPLALDLAISSRACSLKGVKTPIEGKADILLVPDLVSGNILGKALVHLAAFAAGGIIMGAACPIIILSRADSAQERLNSIILGVNYVQYSGN